MDAIPNTYAACSSFAKVVAVVPPPAPDEEVLRFDGRNWVGKLTFSAGPVTVRMLATPHSLVLAPHSLPGGGGYPCKQYSCDDILHILSAAMGWRYVSLRDALAGGRGALFLATGLRGAGAPRIMRPCKVSTISTLG